MAEQKMKGSDDPDVALESALRRQKSKSSSGRHGRNKHSPDRHSSEARSSRHGDNERKGDSRRCSPDRKRSEHHRDAWKPQERSEKKEEKKTSCYRCGDPGHYVKFCPQEKDKNQPTSR